MNFSINKSNSIIKISVAKNADVDIGIDTDADFLDIKSIGYRVLGRDIVLDEDLIFTY